MILSCLTCAKAFQEAGGHAAGWAICSLLIIIVGILGAVGFCMLKISKKETGALPDKYRDPLTGN